VCLSRTGGGGYREHDRGTFGRHALGSQTREFLTASQFSEYGLMMTRNFSERRDSGCGNCVGEQALGKSRVRYPILYRDVVFFFFFFFFGV
jgi:hypothetical protein